MISIQCQLRNLNSIEITAFSGVLFIFFLRYSTLML